MMKRVCAIFFALIMVFATIAIAEENEVPYWGGAGHIHLKKKPAKQPARRTQTHPQAAVLPRMIHLMH